MTPAEIRKLGIPLDDVSDDVLEMIWASWESWQRHERGMHSQTYNAVGDVAYYFAGYLQGDLDRRRYP